MSVSNNILLWTVVIYKHSLSSTCQTIKLEPLGETCFRSFSFDASDSFSYDEYMSLPVQPKTIVQPVETPVHVSVQDSAETSSSSCSSKSNRYVRQILNMYL